MIKPVETTPVAVQTVRPAQTVTEIQSTVYRIHSTAQPNAAANTRKGLSLTVSLKRPSFPYFIILRVRTALLYERAEELAIAELV